MHIIGAINVDSLHLVEADKPKVNGDYTIYHKIFNEIR